MAPPTTDPRLRFARRLRRDGACIIWTGPLNTAGYGLFDVGKIGRRSIKMLAHRQAWVFAFGAIPDRLCVLHRCDVRACVNPEHLWLGTMSDNMKDALAKGRAFPPHLRPHRVVAPTSCPD